MKFNLRPYSIEVIERPERELGTRKRRKIVTELTRVARASHFGPKMTEKDVAMHVLPVDELFIIRQNGRAVGFSSNQHLHLPSGKMLYLAGTAIEKESTGSGLYNLIRPFSVLYALSRGAEFQHVGSRTQNPIVYASLAKAGLHPRISGEKVPAEFVNVAAHLANHLSPGKKFDRETLMIRAAYDRPLYDEMPQHRDAAVNRFVYDRFLSNLDALLIVGELDRPRMEELFSTAAGGINKKEALKILANLRARHEPKLANYPFAKFVVKLLNLFNLP